MNNLEISNEQMVDSLDGQPITESCSENSSKDESSTGKPIRDKAARFKELAETRTSNVINAMESLGKLASNKNYDYTKEQVEQMFDAMQRVLDEVKQSFLETKQAKKRFSFK